MLTVRIQEKNHSESIMVLKLKDGNGALFAVSLHHLQHILTPVGADQKNAQLPVRYQPLGMNFRCLNFIADKSRGQGFLVLLLNNNQH